MKQINVRSVCSDYYQHHFNNHLPGPVVETNYFERVPAGLDPCDIVVDELDGIKGFSDLVKEQSSKGPWDL